MEWHTGPDIEKNQSATFKVESNGKAVIGHHQEPLLFSIEVYNIKVIINNFNIILNS